MAASDLTSLTAVKTWLQAIGTSTDSQLAPLITAVSRAIYTKLQRPNLLPAPYLEILPIPPSNKILLKAWPVVSISAVTIGSTTVPAASPYYSGNGYVLETVDPSPPSRPQSLYFGTYGRYGYSGYDGCSWGYPIGCMGSVQYVAGYQTTETQTVASGSVISTSPYGAWASDQGVTYASTGIALSAVTGSPAQGQYSVAIDPAFPSQAVYTFNSADNGASVVLSYGFVPADLAQAATEWVGHRFKAASIIGLRSKSLGGQETMAFDTGSMPSFVSDAIQPYRRVVMT